MARVLIAGCGYVGCALGERLVARSDRVWGMRRRPLSLPAGVEPLEADLAVSHTLRDLPPDLDHVVYAASPGGRDDAHYRTAYVEGMTRLLEALSEQGQRPRRIFFLSSTAVYAQSRGEWVDETSETEPTHFSGRRLLEAEAILAGSPFASTVLRLGGIYGPTRTRLIDQVREGRATYPRSGPRYTNRIHRDDVAGFLVHLMDAPGPSSLYLTVDDDPAEEAVVKRWLAGALGAPEPRAEKGTPEGRRGRSNKRCRNARLRGTGYELLYPSFREGYAAVIDGMR
ncbi:MAG: SDR family oxidoreductase [Myxococcota bacterium]